MKITSKIAYLFVMAMTFASCGGKTGTLEITVITPVGDDPFIGAANAHILVGNPKLAEAVVPVSDGHFSANLKFPLKSNSTGYVLVEALASDGTVLGSGRSPVVTMQAIGMNVTVWVGRPGQVGLSPQVLGRGRTGAALCNVANVGVLIAGGSVDGQPVTDVEVYNVFAQTLDAASPLPSARTGAIALGVTSETTSTGGALLAGGGTPEPSGDMLSFNAVEVVGGLWQVVATNASLARLSPLGVQLTNGSWLIAGGTDGNGLPLASAALVTVGTNQVSATPPMAGARLGDVVLGGSFGDNEGAFFFGGVDLDQPIAERFILANSNFIGVDLADIVPRSYATASYTADGRVLLAGGTDGVATSLASGIILTPSTLAAEIAENLLPTPRSHHVAFTSVGEIVFCGGIDDNGQPLATCDVIDATTLVFNRTIPLATPRLDMNAITLDNGVTLLVGGVGLDGVTPSAALELYTPAS